MANRRIAHRRLSSQRPLYERVEALTWVGRASTRDHQHARACQWLPQHSPPQPNPVGMLALTKKSRTGILELISTLSGGRSGRTCVAGRSRKCATLKQNPLATYGGRLFRGKIATKRKKVAPGC